MKNPKVSIITPLFYGERYIGEAIESALGQTFENFELLIVNDGSTDNSETIVAKYLNDPRIHYFEKENGGVASARNYAIGKAKGDWIGFLDQDDRWLPDKLQRQLSALENNPGAALIHARQTYIDSNNKAIDSYHKDWVAPLEGNCFSQLFDRNRIAVLSVLLKKSVLDEIGPFNEKISRVDDYELWLRIALRQPILFLDGVVAEYRLHEENASHDHFRMEKAELEALTTFLDQNLEARARLSRRQINRRFGVLHTELANGYLWQEQNDQKARRHFFNSLKHQPFHGKNIRRLIWYSLERNFRNRLAWYFRKFFPAQIDSNGRPTRL